MNCPLAGIDLEHTLYISNALQQDLLHRLRILQLLHDLVDDGVRQLLLLPYLDLAFIPHPRVESGFGLLGKGGPLLQLKGLGF